MSKVLDPEGAHLAALRRLADFRGARVIEVGRGRGDEVHAERSLEADREWTGPVHGRRALSTL